MDRSPEDSQFPESAPFSQESAPIERCDFAREAWPEALERREADRRESGFSVQILWRGERIPAVLRDLSRSGMSLRTDVQLSAGEPVQVELDGNSTLVWGWQSQSCLRPWSSY
ncbi:MAG: PilZ domain-containing protein [bacterium]|nr:PilZ domain-containing protein [bacterium]